MRVCDNTLLIIIGRQEGEELEWLTVIDEKQWYMPCDGGGVGSVRFGYSYVNA